MTPQGKAKELFKKYSKGTDEFGWSLCEWDSGAKECALIAVDELINELDDITNFTGNKYSSEMIKFWQEVKQEIEKL